MTSRTLGKTCALVQERALEFLVGDLRQSDRELGLSHLVSCALCADYLAKLLPTLVSLRELRLVEPTSEATAAGLGEYVREYGAKGASQLKGDTETVDLDSGSSRVQEGRRQSRSLKSALEDLCSALIDEALSKVAYVEPPRAIALAKAATSIAETVPALQSNKRLRIRCHRGLAAMQMLASDVQAARESIKRAFDLSHQCESCLEEKAELLMTSASIDSGMGRTRQAEAALSEAAAIFESLGRIDDSWKVKINLAACRLRTGEPEEPIALLLKARDAYQERRMPASIAYTIYLNLAIAYCETNNLEAAEDVLPQLSEAVNELGGDTLVHFRWLAGTMARVRGGSEEALSAFSQVRLFFLERRQAIHFVESTLDICRVYASQSDWARMSSLVEETGEVLRGFCSEERILAAMSLLEVGVERRRLSENEIKLVLGLLVGRRHGGIAEEDLAGSAGRVRRPEG